VPEEGALRHELVGRRGDLLGGVRQALRYHAGGWHCETGRAGQRGERIAGAWRFNSRPVVARIPD